MRSWLSKQRAPLRCYRHLQRLAYLTPRVLSIPLNCLAFRKRYLRDFSDKFFFVLPSAAIGPAVQSIELLFRHCRIHDIDLKKDVVVVTRSAFCNPYLLDMLKRQANVIVDDVIVDEIENGGDRYLAKHKKSLIANFRNGDMLSTPWEPTLPFSEEEIERGYHLLSKIGISKGDRWVALHNKDDYYYRNVRGVGKNWDSYRDSAFSALLPAIQYLKEQGFHVIRTGHYSDKDDDALPYLSLNGFTTEEQAFLGLFIQYGAYFSMNGCSGIANIPLLFNTPCLCHNAIPLGEPPVIERGIIIPKVIQNADGKNLSAHETTQISTFLGYPVGSKYWVSEVTADAFQASYLYEKYGLQIIDNSEQDLLDGVKEMISYIEGSLQLTESQTKLQNRFRMAFRQGHPMRHFEGIVSPAFLQREYM